MQNFSPVCKIVHFKNLGVGNRITTIMQYNALEEAWCGKTKVNNLKLFAFVAYHLTLKEQWSKLDAKFQPGMENNTLEEAWCVKTQGETSHNFWFCCIYFDSKRTVE